VPGPMIARWLRRVTMTIVSDFSCKHVLLGDLPTKELLPNCRSYRKKQASESPLTQPMRRKIST
jgi:hypothetical protein